MIVFDEAIRRLLEIATPLGTETVSIDRAANRILAAPVTARSNMPAQDVSMMDGYAARDADLGDIPFSLPVSGESFAGSEAPSSLRAGSLCRIFTGAPVPDGADRVIVQENIERDGDTARIVSAFGSNRFIRKAGSDFRAGDVLLPVGHRLSWRSMTTAAAADRADVDVFRSPRVAIIATGDELATPGKAHETRGAIPESVSLGVATLAESRGASVVNLERQPDDLDILKRAASNALELADVVVIAGGASVGERDFSRLVFGEPLKYIFPKVAIKPGKPVWLARAGGRLVVGLPGNPTSALVTARLFLAPLLIGLSGGDASAELNFETTICRDALPATSDRETFLRASQTPDGLRLAATQNSASQRSLAFADVLIRRAPSSPAAPQGAEVSILKF
jgi:molybdopterin molybdotransferase